VGVKLPNQRLTTSELMSQTRHQTRIQLERLTGIHERRVVGPGETSFTLAVGAARDCLAHSRHQAADIEMLISTSITRSKGGSSQSFEPPLSLYIKDAIGAGQAANFDLSNACAGMLTGVFLLQDLVTRGEISCGMVVSGEYISPPQPQRRETDPLAVQQATRFAHARRRGRGRDRGTGTPRH
jgi:3-oxoacyl-[acyl-carrier-protein] synthase-3